MELYSDVVFFFFSLRWMEWVACMIASIEGAWIELVVMVMIMVGRRFCRPAIVLMIPVYSFVVPSSLLQISSFRL